jgi:hypothetical protein
MCRTLLGGEDAWGPVRAEYHPASALENSTAVLRSVLTDEEWQYFLSHREVDIAGPSGARYRLQAGQIVSNVRYLPPHRHKNGHWRGACIHVSVDGRDPYRVTAEENLAAQVCMIKADEETFLATAVWGS